MSEVSLVFPHQLFEIRRAGLLKQVVMIEDELFFRQFPFHKKKLVLHRASMQWYRRQLQDKGHEVLYYASADQKSLDTIFSELAGKNVKTIRIAGVDDYLLDRRITRYSRRHKLTIERHPNPNFICTLDEDHKAITTSGRYNLTSFYIALRKKKGVLNHAGQPLGGKWTYDTENRKRLPKNIELPPAPPIVQNIYVTEAIDYVNKHFAKNYGDTDNFQFPIDRSSALAHYKQFLTKRFQQYGDYQDAIEQKDSYLFHSVLTPMLNIGLIDADEVVKLALQAGDGKKIPLNSLEGFIRQVMGWREFIRLVYHREGVKQRTSNYFGHNNPMPPSFYDGTTGIEPIDNVIRKALRTGYTNHIERLMILGNFMFLCEIKPDHVYQWFMEFYIDAYDWVMVPNVYGMSQYSDGGLMSTKPYISGSNYVLKMSNFKSGPWCEVWDALYWSFIDKHKKVLSENPRMTLITKLSEKIDRSKMKAMKKTKEDFLKRLYNL